jgi:AcrR family transcriptional regulator
MRNGAPTRERILAGALRLFVERGLNQTTTKDIAQAAGIAEGTIYRHFGSKDALAWDIFATNFTAFARVLERAHQPHPLLRAKLEAMVGRFCVFFDQDRTLFTYLLLSQHGHLQRVTEDMAHPVIVLRDVIADGIRRREIPGRDPEVLTAMVMGLVLQTALHKIYARIQKPLADMADVLAASAWSVLSREDG